MDLRIFVIALISALCLGRTYSLPTNATDLEANGTKPTLGVVYPPSKSTTILTPPTAPSQNTSTTTISAIPSSTTKIPTTIPFSTTKIPTTIPSNTTKIPTTIPSNTTKIPTTIPSNTTKIPTTIPSNTTKIPTTIPTTAPSTIHEHSTQPAFINDRQFDGPSFIGGIVLTVGLTAIGFIAFKYFRASRVGKEPDYRNLHGT